MAMITGLLLAAGASQRFGRQKLLANLAGQALIVHSARSLSVCMPVLAVVRAEDDEIHRVLRQAGLAMTINPRAGQGMGSSIAAGVAASEQSDGWCILPADMPRVQPGTTQTILHALQNGAQLAAPFYHTKRGHPVGIGRVFKDELLGLSGAAGARTILEAHAQQLVEIATEDAGVLQDIDTLQDLAVLTARGQPDPNNRPG